MQQVAGTESEKELADALFVCDARLREAQVDLFVFLIIAYGISTYYL